MKSETKRHIEKLAAERKARRIGTRIARLDSLSAEETEKRRERLARKSHRSELRRQHKFLKRHPALIGKRAYQDHQAKSRESRAAQMKRD
jgi:hypothetical protein